MFHLTTELDNKVADFHVEGICLLPGRGLTVHAHAVLSTAAE